MRTALKLTALCALIVGTALAPVAARTDAPVLVGPTFESIGPLAFGPNGVLYAADKSAATIFALDLGAQSAGKTPGTKDVPAIDQKVASLLGTDVREITITDLAVHPTSRNSFLSVMRGQGAGAQSALVRVDGAGTLEVVTLDAMQFTKVTLPNPAAVNPNGRGGRADAITDMAFSNGRLFVAGLSNEEFASKLWSVPYPFGATADNGTSVEIFHGNHNAYETRSPVYAFVPTNVGGQPSLIAGYLCTPLVQFPVGDLKPGAKIMGKTIAELGNRNRPIDMVLYQKDGKQFLLMTNTSRGVMKLDTAEFAKADAITTRVAEKGGVPYETITAMTGVEQLDLLNATHTIVLARDEARVLNLRAVVLP
ncbi:MAG TPA: hypothetical protein VFO19_06260 [Vicinamibacterales bacterium]|nr:hypothetical protein [Vicinamibacterales bacterium]